MLRSSSEISRFSLLKDGKIFSAKNIFRMISTDVGLIDSNVVPLNIRLKTEWSSALPYKKIPGPSVLSLIKDFSIPGQKYYKAPMPYFMEQINKEYGDIVKMKGVLRKKDIVFIYDPDDFEMIFRTEGIWPIRYGMDTFEHYRKFYRPEIFRETGGLAAEQGKDWYDFRTKVNPIMMKTKTVEIYVPVIEDVAKEFVQNIRDLRDANNQVPKSFQKDISKWALESIGFIALNTRLGVLKSIDKNSRGHKLIQYVREFFEQGYQLDFCPSLWRYFATPLYKKQMKSLDNLTMVIMEYVDETRKKLENKSITTNGQSVFEKLLKIDRKTSIVMAIDMLIGGVDSTSALASTLFYCLAKNPKQQEKLRKEVFEVLPDKNGSLSKENFKNLPYLRACIKETLRLHPVISGNFREAAQDLVLKGYQIPKGTGLMMDNLKLFRDEKYYPKSNEFWPERWLKHVEQTDIQSYKSAHPFIYLPFGFGPRTCIGRRFAQMETELLTIQLLRNFKIEWNHNKEIERTYGLINIPCGDVSFTFIDLK